MATSLPDDDVRDRVRAKLNDEKVKLWLPPYTDEEGNKGQVAPELLARYGKELDLSEELVEDALEALRLHALDKLAAKKKFSNSGVATLKVKLAGNIPNTVQNHNWTMEISLTVNGLDLRHTVGQRCGIPAEILKLIASGRVIEDGSELRSQGVGHMSAVMALCLSQSEVEARRYDDQMALVAKTREAAELLSSKQDGGQDGDENYYLQLADQTGKAIDLPPEERKALVFAMTLHEKGRASIKRKQHAEALLLLLESDKEFMKCRSDILKAVDNYALVCLDIVWCYLCLKNVSALPDAERLKSCDDCFRRSYGPNLERLALVKGGTGSERALFMRLHLLQGIVAFHRGHQEEAQVLLARAENELKKLTVDQETMTQVMTMGFTQLEARLGLRVSEGNVAMAIAHIMQRREEKKSIKDKEKAEKRKKKLARKLGKTASGHDVDISHYDSLLSMGFGKGASAEALRQSNNDITRALQVLEEHPELLCLPDPDPPDFKITDEMLSQVTALGFDLEAARAALHHFQGDLQQSIEELLSVGSAIPQQWIDAVQAWSSSSSSGSSTGSSSPIKSPGELDREKELVDSILPDIPDSEEDHLDLSLEDEQQFLQEYKSLLGSL